MIKNVIFIFKILILIIMLLVFFFLGNSIEFMNNFLEVV